MKNKNFPAGKVFDWQDRSIRVGGNVGGNVISGNVTGSFNNESQQQNLAQAAAEIQELLEQLSQTYPTETLSQKAVVAEKAVELIEKNPTLKQRVGSAIKAMGVEALMEAIDHPVANVLRAGVEAFKEPS